jgi:SAM-dependent methyltransferase
MTRSDRKFEDIYLSPSFRCDQGEVLTEGILSFVRERGSGSLLDIGAGTGNVAAPLSREVPRYLAIEQDTSRYQCLRQLGLNVIQATFPIKLAERFDMVVASHSIPEADAELYEPFLTQAWDLVEPGGLFLIITFKGRGGTPISRLSEEITGRKWKDDYRYQLMIDILRTCGEISITEIVSHVKSEEFSDIATVFRSWFWKTEEEEARIRPLLQSAMESRFKNGSEFCVPTPHRIVATSKTRELQPSRIQKESASQGGADR